jgi:heme/copper-type cytochrome/quinol oxidase subunit 2
MSESDSANHHEPPKPGQEEKPKAGRSTIWFVLAAILLLVLVVGIVFAVTAMVRNPQQTETIRDIVIIFVAVEALLIGLALIVLVIQIARLTDLLRNEIGPILESTNDTLGNLRGTSRFLSENMVKPVIKANSSLAAVRRIVELLGFRRNRN